VTQEQPVELRRVPLLEALGREHLDEIALLGRPVRFPAGRLIFQQGEEGDGLYIIAHGDVRVFYSGDDGSEATIALLSEGESLGELALIDGGPRSAAALALSDTTAVAITHEDFAQWLEHRPEATRALLTTLSERVRRTNQELAELVLLDLAERLARRLLSLLETNDGPKIRITQAELGGRLGVTREAVNKQLRVLAQQGIITRGRGSVTVLDRDALRAAGSLD
jgi:CRP/FNR family cyclic AMP-dependent transcriptional regulator